MPLNAFKPSVALAVVHSKVVILLLFIRCWLLLPLWNSVIVLCFVVRYCVSIIVLQSSRGGRKSWWLCFDCPPGVSWLLCGSSSWYHGFVCSLWLWYFPDHTHLLFFTKSYNLYLSRFSYSIFFSASSYYKHFYLYFFLQLHESTDHSRPPNLSVLPKHSNLSESEHLNHLISV